MTAEIPEQCLNCPVVQNVQRVIRAHEEQEAEFIKQLMSDDLENLFEEMPGLADYYDVSTPKELAETLRKAGSQQLEASEAHTETHRVQLAKITRGCLGAMVHEAENADTTFVVTACASPEIPRDTGPVQDTVIVDRRSKN